jgi:sugar lactone lactonase YvrE
MRGGRRWVALCVLLGAASGAFAKPAADDGFDQAALLAHVIAAKDAATTVQIAKKYQSMEKVLGKRDKGGLVDDLGRLDSALRLSDKLPVADLDLIDLIIAAARAADVVLDVPARDAVSDLIQQIESPDQRSKVEAAGLKGQDLRDAGHAVLITHAAETQMADILATLRAAAKQYAKAEKIGRALLRRQKKTLPQFLTPEPHHIYTVVGNHAGGFNGNFRPARRSSLYFVEDVTIGPDGRLYINDFNNHRVRVRQDDGTLAPFFASGIPGDSEGPPLEMKVNHIGQMIFDPAGRMLLAVWHNHKIKVWDPNGGNPTTYTIAGAWQGNSPPSPDDATPFVPTDAFFNLMPGLLLLPEGHPLGGGDLLITDSSNARVLLVKLASDPITAVDVAGTTVQTGMTVRKFGTGLNEYNGDGLPADQAGFGFSRFQNAQPDGRMVIDVDGNIYVVQGAFNVIRKVAPDGTASTFAGTGVAGFSGDGGPATQAQLDFPSDVAVGIDGRTIFISDKNNEVVRKVDPDGTISTYAGTPKTPGYAGDEGPAGDALFSHPSGLDVDADGNLYICDRDNHVVRVVASDTPGDVKLPIEAYTMPVRSRGGAPTSGASGTISTLAGDGGLSFNGDGLPALDCSLYWPQDITVEPFTNLVVFSDWNNERIRRIDADGAVRTILGTGEIGDDSGNGTSIPLNHPTDMAYDPIDGDLWIASWHTDKILRLSGTTNEVTYMAGGRRGFDGDGGPAIDAKLNLSVSVKFDSLGNWFIADEANLRVRYVDRATNIISTLAGTGEATSDIAPLGDGGPADQATLNFPVGQDAQPAGRIALDPTEQYLYIADTNNHRIRRVDLVTKIITTVAGTGDVTDATHPLGDGGPALAATFNGPTDVDCDGAGNVYVADQDNNAIRKIDIATGVVTTVAGNGVAGAGGDGGPAPAAQLTRPSGIFVVRTGPQAGRLYIADTFNSLLRVVWE